MLQWYPGAVISSQGAEIIVERSCFYDNYLVGSRLSPYAATIMLAGDDAPDTIQSSDNYAVGKPTSHEECLFVGKLGSDGSLKCLTQADAPECLSSVDNQTITW